MPKKNNSQEYWAKRRQQDKIKVIKEGEKGIDNLKRLLKTNLDDVQAKIRNFYEKYGENPAEKMSYSEWQKYKAKLKRMAQQNPQDEFLQRLAKQNIPKYQIDRLRALELDLQMQLTEATQGQAQGIYNTLDDVARVSQSVLSKSMQASIGLKFNTIADRKLKQLLSSDWSGANWSDRLWHDRVVVGKKVTEILQKGVTQGTSLQKMARELKQTTNQSFNNAFRLIRTETSHIDGQVTLEGYKQAGEELGLEYYEYDAFLDSRTSTLCRDLDKKRFKVSEAEVGINYPPMHPNCRSTTQLVLDEDYSQETKYHGNSKEEAPKLEEKEPARISGAKQGKPMSWKEANSGNVNPNYLKGGGYNYNCQSCVACFEARLRGYNISALPFNKNNKAMQELSINPTLAFKNAKIIDSNVNSKKECIEWLNSIIKPNERYAFAHMNQYGGHILIATKTISGKLKLYDPQSGGTKTNKILDSVIYKINDGKSFVIVSPKAFKINDLELNIELLNKISAKR